MTEEKKLEGLRGWLILIGLGLIYAPIRFVTSEFPIAWEVFSSGAWEVRTTPGSGAYNPLLASIFIGEIVITGGLVLAHLFTAFLFFSKKKIFPKWFIGITVSSLSYILNTTK